MMATAGALLAGITVAATLITSHTNTERAEQREAAQRDRAERAETRADNAEARADELGERLDCRALYNAAVDNADLASDRAEHALVSLVARQIIASTPPNQSDFLEAIERLDDTNAEALRAVRDRDEWTQAGQPIPCPLAP